MSMSARGLTALWLLGSALLPGRAQALPPSSPTPGNLERPGVLAPLRARSGRSRPVVAVLAEQGGTETTDLLVPYGVLAHSEAAEVIVVAPAPGPIRLFPALRILPEATLADFDARFPEGADAVIVPALRNPRHPGILAWLKAQSDKGAVSVGICNGVLTLGHAGLLEGRRATGFWFSQRERERAFTRTTWLRNRRFVQDGPIITTAGVTASMPVSLALVEAIAGPGKARAVAEDMGAKAWGPHHDSASFRFGLRGWAQLAGNALAFWRHERILLPVADGTDEIALALVADAYASTFRSQALSTAASRSPIRTRHGLRLLPDAVGGAAPEKGRSLTFFNTLPPLAALDQALADIEATQGPGTARLVAAKLEYPRPRAAQSRF